MQYNIFLIELLGDDNLKGVSIPVVIDNKNSLNNDKMADIAKVLNCYRTVFVKSNNTEILNTKIYSIQGESKDCFYASVAALYSLTETSYIREIESGEKSMTVKTDGCTSKVSIFYDDRAPKGVLHEIDIPNIKIKESKNQKDYTEEEIEELENPNSKSCILYTDNPTVFSKLRKSSFDEGEKERDCLIVNFEKEFETLFFYVKRAKHKDENRLESRSQIGIIVKYLLEKGINPGQISKICHILNTGQYAVMNTNIEEEKIYAKMNAKTLVEGILNI